MQLRDHWCSSILGLNFLQGGGKALTSCLECREQILERKRREYRDMVPNYYDIQAAERSVEDDTALRQVLDLPPRLSALPCVLDSG